MPHGRVETNATHSSKVEPSAPTQQVSQHRRRDFSVADTALLAALQFAPSARPKRKSRFTAP